MEELERLDSMGDGPGFGHAVSSCTARMARESGVPADPGTHPGVTRRDQFGGRMSILASKS